MKVPHGICSLVYLYNGDLKFFSYNEQLKGYEETIPSEETINITWEDFKDKFGISRKNKI